MASRQAKDCVEFTGTIMRETEKAIQFDVEGQTTEWFPFSQTEKLTRDDKTVGKDKITVTKWIADKKNLEY